MPARSMRENDDDDDVYCYIGERQELAGETENMCIDDDDVLDQELRDRQSWGELKPLIAGLSTAVVSVRKERDVCIQKTAMRHKRGE